MKKFDLSRLSQFESVELNSTEPNFGLSVFEKNLFTLLILYTVVVINL